MQDFTTKYDLGKAEVEILSWTVRHDLAYKKDMAGTFATQFVSGSPKADRRT